MTNPEETSSVGKRPDTTGQPRVSARTAAFLAIAAFIAAAAGAAILPRLMSAQDRDPCESPEMWYEPECICPEAIESGDTQTYQDYNCSALEAGSDEDFEPLPTPEPDLEQ